MAFYHICISEPESKLYSKTASMLKILRMINIATSLLLVEANLLSVDLCLQTILSTTGISNFLELGGSIGDRGPFQGGSERDPSGWALKTGCIPDGTPDSTLQSQGQSFVFRFFSSSNFTEGLQ